MRLGLFGGTFDPPHIGHLIAAQDAQLALKLDRVLFIPAGTPPHKRVAGLSPVAARLEMVRAAVAGNASFEVDELEIVRAGPSYTVDTLRTYRERHPDAALYLLLGADQFTDFPKWHEPDEIRRLSTLVVLERAGSSTVAGVTTVAVTRVDVSGTEIRRRVHTGESIRYLVPDPVVQCIERHRLYRSAPETR